MKFTRLIFYCAVFILVTAGLCGCFPGGNNHLDEEKDPHFQRGRDLVNSQEFKAAVDEYEQALETNPRSASAHYELGWLYDTKINDYAAAIYHYQRHLLLAPNSPRAQLVRERIRGCKLELASTEYPLPNSQNLQREVDRLTQENRLLKQQLDAARSHPGETPAAAPALPAVSSAVSSSVSSTVASAKVEASAKEGPVQPRAVPAALDTGHPRVYVIQARDTITSVAARYGLKPKQVLAANPEVNPTRLRIGQNLNLP
jgi:tetratricopeptide (TPR) repeat protein